MVLFWGFFRFIFIFPYWLQRSQYFFSEVGPVPLSLSIISLPVLFHGAKCCFPLERLAHLYISECVAIYCYVVNRLFFGFFLMLSDFISLTVSASPTLLIVWFIITATTMGIPLIWAWKMQSHFAWLDNSLLNSVKVNVVSLFILVAVWFISYSLS